MTVASSKVSPARLFFAAAGLVLISLCLPVNLVGQRRPTAMDTLRVQAVSRANPKLPASTRSIQLLTAEDISSLPVRTISEALEWATGVEVLSRSPAQSDLSIRGASFEQVVVLVNGVRMSDPQTGHFDLDLAVPLESVERVEVLRGAASALYGADAMGGVVNVVTRAGKQALAGSVQGGSWGTMRVSAQGGIDAGESGGEMSAGGEATRSDGHREGTDYKTALLHLSFSNPLLGGRFSGELGTSRRDFGAQDFYAPYPSFEKTRSHTASVGWESGGSGLFDWEMLVSARQHDDEFVLVRNDPSFYQNQHTSSQGGGTVLGRYAAGQGIDAAIGGELFLDGLSSSNLGDRSERHGALFAEAIIGNPGFAILSLGARTDWHQGYGAFFSPSLSGSVMVLSGLRARAAVGRSFRAPTWTERYYQDPVNIGNPDLDPERALSGELGLDLFRFPGFSIATTVFVRYATALIDWAKPDSALDSDPWETRNVEDATYRGIEADVEFTGPLSLEWTLGVAALSVKSEEADGYFSKYALRPLTEQVTLGVERSFGSLASVLARFRHGRREGEESHRKLDLRLKVRVGAGWLYLDALNITNFEYLDVTGARAPGRAWFAGFSIAQR